ncbi:MAG: NADH-quinone oxidoreductase subunit M [Gammaproteobacteria bacterium]
MQYLLSLLIWLPIVAGVYVMCCGNAKTARYVSLLALLLSLLLCIPLVVGFSTTGYQMQFVEQLAWLPQFGIEYKLGVDGFSMPLIVLTTFTTFIVILTSWSSIQTKTAQYFAAFLIMQGLLVGVFSALNAVLFYIFWEASLIPMYLIIGIWGSSNRVYAAIKFFLYTLLGSLMMLAAFLYLAWQAGTFDILTFYGVPLTMMAQILIFVAFFLGFAVKVPMWPVHTWLPDAHTEAPAGGSIILAAILLKLGAYGFLRFTLPIVPDAAQYLAWPMIILSLVAVVYVALVAIVQTDVKRLIAYSSISHMGFVTLGFFVLYLIATNTGDVAQAALAFEGGIFVMISHGFISGALFAGVGFIYDRLHTREIKDFGGIVNSMPIFAAFFMLFAMANAGLPGTSGFVGEFMVIVGSFKAGFWIAFAAATTLVFGAAYTLWMYKRVIFGSVANEKIASLQDIRGFELLAFSLLGFAVLFFGVYPMPILEILHSSVEHLLNLSVMSKL